MENATFAWSGFSVEEFPNEVATGCVEGMECLANVEL